MRPPPCCDETPIWCNLTSTICYCSLCIQQKASVDDQSFEKYDVSIQHHIIDNVQTKKKAPNGADSL
jgi:hypothetical protein